MYDEDLVMPAPKSIAKDFKDRFEDEYFGEYQNPWSKVRLVECENFMRNQRNRMMLKAIAFNKGRKFQPIHNYFGPEAQEGEYFDRGRKFLTEMVNHELKVNNDYSDRTVESLVNFISDLKAVVGVEIVSLVVCRSAINSLGIRAFAVDLEPNDDRVWEWENTIHVSMLNIVLIMDKLMKNYGEYDCMGEVINHIKDTISQSYAENLFILLDTKGYVVDKIRRLSHALYRNVYRMRRNEMEGHDTLSWSGIKIANDEMNQITLGTQFIRKAEGIRNCIKELLRQYCIYETVDIDEEVVTMDNAYEFLENLDSFLREEDIMEMWQGYLDKIGKFGYRDSYSKNYEEQ